MEENVALDPSKQKKFIKSIKVIKKLIKKEQPVENPAPNKVVKGGKRKKRISNRGLVYLSHIPHGFYENEMTQYFKQFGKVTNVRVIRSRRTGMSKGCAFVEFGQPAVAQIVAETMNNYLMGKRLIKAEVVPAEKQRIAFRKNWNAVNNPANNFRVKFRKEFNENKTDEQHLKKAKRLLKNLTQTKQKLKDIGVDYDFFTAVDIPVELLNKAATEDEPPKLKNKKSKIIREKKVEKPSTISKIKSDCSDETKKNGDVVKKTKPTTTEPKQKVLLCTKIKVEKPSTKSKIKSDCSDETKKNGDVVKKTKPTTTEPKQKVAKTTEQKEKKSKNLKSPTKPPKNFIKVLQSDDSDGDSDGSLAFDSDEFAAQDFDEEFDSEDDAVGSSEEDEPPKKRHVKNIQLTSAKKIPSQPPVKINKTKLNVEKNVKRKVAQKTESSANTQKFEKKGKPSKLFKKRK